MVQSKRGIAVKEILFNNEINFKVVVCIILWGARNEARPGTFAYQYFCCKLMLDKRPMILFVF